MIQGAIGILLFLAIAFMLSEQKKQISWKKIIQLALFQIALMILFLRVTYMQKAFLFLAQGIRALQESVTAGTSFVFGYLGGGNPPFALQEKGSLFIFMFQALPMIVVMSALSMLLFHWGALPWIVKKISVLARKIGCIGGALGTAMAGKIFLGQTDTPLLVKPYLERFSRHELFSLMTAGMATTSLALFSLYATLLEPAMGNTQALMHIVTGALINIPASLIIAELIIPGKDMTEGTAKNPYTFTNAMQAITQGTMDGWNMMWAIAAMMIVALAFVHLGNAVWGNLTHWIIGVTLPIEILLGYVFAPFAWCMGIPSHDMLMAGTLLAKKTVLNEVIALIDVSRPPFITLSPKSIPILVYSLCGFGNLSSIGIQIAGLGILAPMRKDEIVALAPWALVAALLAGGLSSALVSLIL